jgi:two-component system phosphate regulon response regulator PhoB
MELFYPLTFNTLKGRFQFSNRLPSLRTILSPSAIQQINNLYHMSANKPQRVLVIDDEPDVTELLQYKFEQEGYICRVLNDPLSFVGVAREFQPDLMVLDIMMPELNGMQLCRIARSDSTMKDIPIVFLTARGDPEDRVKGLEKGADDYISKPFNSRELILRIRNILNRGGKSEESRGKARIQIAGVAIDEDLHELRIDDQPVILTATEFRLLKLLMERKGRVQSRENLLVNVWHYDTDIETRTVDTHVRRVREKLGPYAHLIETVRGVGYRAVEIK